LLSLCKLWLTNRFVRLSYNKNVYTKLKHIFVTLQLKYTSFLEEVISSKINKAELPVQEESHFEKFNIKYRNAESKEEVKQAISFLENKALLLHLIPIAFNEDLESET